ncbi:phage holin family protein [Georgenia faecalis]|uniref:phage holin family protein n=1 Tax=Georgenia faecalis TaxID=2483799 RepID=UPI000FD895FB|nr:phage holin family protein [Georgenia faecalis]
MTTPNENLGSTAVPPSAGYATGTPGAVPAGAYGAPGASATPAPRAASNDPQDASLGEIVGTITRDISTLMRQEVELAKVELKQSATQAGKGAGLFAGAGVAGNYVLLFLSLALWWVLGAWIGDGDAVPALGWSALIVAIIWAVIAAVLASMGRKEAKRAKGMPQTADTVKKIPDALKGQEHA